MKQPVRVVIADDHRLLRHSVKLYLQLGGAVQVVGEGATGHEALSLVAELRPDVVLLDVNMPVLGGLETVRQLKELHPDLKVIMLSSSGDHASVTTARRNGADAYLLKGTQPQHLWEAIASVTQGLPYATAEVRASFLQTGSDPHTPPLP